MLCPHRLTIITGHYGTGKTEFAVNLALHKAAAGERVALADLDIVNPYFRSRERKDLLSENGIALVASSQSCTDADVPALPARLHSILDDRSITGTALFGRIISFFTCSTQTALRFGMSVPPSPICGPSNLSRG